MTNLLLFSDTLQSQDEELIREGMFAIELNRKANESLLDYHKRIIYGKLVDKSLSDVDYTELSSLVYGQAYSSDVARRMFYGSRRTLELMDSERVSMVEDTDTLSEIDTKLLELKRERQKYADQRREFNKLVSKEAREEHLYEVLSSAAVSLSESVGSLFAGESTGFDTLADRNDECSAVLVLNDWHYGMVADNIFNKYNTEICKERVRDVVLKTKERLLLHGCSSLHIVILGDLIHGAIHTSARVASEELVADQMMQVSEILAQAIIALSQDVDSVYVHTTYGNHARTIQNKNDSIHRDNMERIIPWWLRQRIAAEGASCGRGLNVTVLPESENEFLIFDVLGHDFCASHGDIDSVKTSPRLLGTLLGKRCGRDIECILLADKHHRESFEELGILSVISGSLCGSDDYANDKRLYSTPSQLLLIVNKENGVDAEYRLSCS